MTHTPAIPPQHRSSFKLQNVEASTIRTAVPSEKAALERLQLRASLTNEGDREALLANPDAIDLPITQITAGDVFVLEMIGRIAGFAALESRPDGDVDLDALFTEPDIQRQGVGRALVDHCGHVALARGCRALHVVGNPHAEAFYLSCGFETVGSSETRFGPALLMKRSLLPSIRTGPN